MAKKIGWGIIGTGYIAEQFATALAILPDAKLQAIGSRTSESAERFGSRFDIPNRYGSYEELANDSSVDVVYIATPHTLHRENMLLCLEANKAVLCEKPFTINAKEAQEVVTVAQSKELFLMEAMWSRFFPVMDKLREVLDSGTIGEIRLITSDFGYHSDFDPEKRIFDPRLGGGALLDVGVYSVSFASMVLGQPDRIVSLPHLGKTGVDEQSAAILGYEQGQLAIFYTSVNVNTFRNATIFGTMGSISIHSPCWTPTTITVLNHHDGNEIHVPYEGNGYNYEASEVNSCLRAGKLESRIMPLNETVSIMKTMDEIRSQWNLRYPSEN